MYIILYILNYIISCSVIVLHCWQLQTIQNKSYLQDYELNHNMISNDQRDQEYEQKIDLDIWCIIVYS